MFLSARLAVRLFLVWVLMIDFHSIFADKKSNRWKVKSKKENSSYKNSYDNGC